MGFLDVLLRRRPEPDGGGVLSAMTITDIDQVLDAAIDGTGIDGRNLVTPESAMRQATVFRCVALISGTVAGLPFHLYRRLEPQGRERVVGEQRARVIRIPNERDTAFELREWIQSHLLLRGNAYLQKVYDRRGQVVELWPLHPDRMSVWQEADGSVRYLYRKRDGQPEAFAPDELVHFRGLGSDGIVGYSVISLAAAAVNMSSLGETFGSTFLQNYARTPIVLETPKTFRKEESVERLRKMWQEMYTGPRNAGKTAILEDGMTAKTIGMTAEDAQFLETRSFQRTDICIWFGVPPAFIGDTEKSTSWGTGIEQQKNGLYTFNILGWCTRQEQRWDRALLEPDELEELYFKHDPKGLLKGELATRYASYAIGRQWGFLSADDIRELEDMNPLPDGQGQRYLEPANMTQPTAAPGQATAETRAEVGDQVEHDGQRLGTWAPVFELTWRRIVRRWLQDLPGAERKGDAAVAALRGQHATWSLGELRPLFLAGGWPLMLTVAVWECCAREMYAATSADLESEVEAVERLSSRCVAATLSLLEGSGGGAG